MEKWNGGKMEEGNGGRMEEWNGGKMEGWKNGMVERWEKDILSGISGKIIPKQDLKFIKIFSIFVSYIIFLIYYGCLLLKHTLKEYLVIYFRLF